MRAGAGHVCAGTWSRACVRGRRRLLVLETVWESCGAPRRGAVEAAVAPQVFLRSLVLYRVLLYLLLP